MKILLSQIPKMLFLGAQKGVWRHELIPLTEFGEELRADLHNIEPTRAIYSLAVENLLIDEASVFSPFIPTVHLMESARGGQFYVLSHAPGTNKYAWFDDPRPENTVLIRFTLEDVGN